MEAAEQRGANHSERRRERRTGYRRRALRGVTRVPWWAINLVEGSEEVFGQDRLFHADIASAGVVNVWRSIFLFVRTGSPYRV